MADQMTPKEALEILVTTAHSAGLEDRKVLDEAEKIIDNCILVGEFWAGKTVSYMPTIDCR